MKSLPWKRGVFKSPPFDGHRTLDEVWDDEKEGCRCHLPNEYGHSDDCMIVLKAIKEGR